LIAATNRRTIVIECGISFAVVGTNCTIITIVDTRHGSLSLNTCDGSVIIVFDIGFVHIVRYIRYILWFIKSMFFLTSYGL